MNTKLQEAKAQNKEMLETLKEFTRLQNHHFRLTDTLMQAIIITSAALKKGQIERAESVIHVLADRCSELLADNKVTELIDSVREDVTKH